MLNHYRKKMRLLCIMLAVCMLMEMMPVKATETSDASVKWTSCVQTEDKTRQAEIVVSLLNPSDSDSENTDGGDCSAAIAEITLSAEEAAALKPKWTGKVCGEDELKDVVSQGPNEEDIELEADTGNAPEGETPAAAGEDQGIGTDSETNDMGDSSTTDGTDADEETDLTNGDSETGEKEDQTEELQAVALAYDGGSEDAEAVKALLVEKNDGSAVLRILLDSSNNFTNTVTLVFTVKDRDLTVDVAEDDIKIYGYYYGGDEADIDAASISGTELKAEITTEPMRVYLSLEAPVEVTQDGENSLNLDSGTKTVVYQVGLSVREEDVAYTAELTLPEGLTLPAGTWSGTVNENSDGTEDETTGKILCGETVVATLSGLPEGATITELTADNQTLRFTLTIPGTEASLGEALVAVLTGQSDGYQVQVTFHGDTFSRAPGEITGNLTFSVNGQTVTTPVTASSAALSGTVTVTEGEAVTQPIFWVDNNNTDSTRPEYGRGEGEFYPVLYYRLTSGDQWIQLTEEALPYFGEFFKDKSEADTYVWPEITENGNAIAVKLPAEIQTTDGYTTTDYTVEWSFQAPATPDGYIFHQKPGDTQSWYYIQSRDFRFNVQLLWGGKEVEQDDILEVLKQFSLYWQYDDLQSGTVRDSVTLEEIISDGVAEITWNEDTGTWQLVIEELWKYSADGNPIDFWTVESGNADGKIMAGDMEETVLDSEDWLEISYVNTDVHNHGTDVDAVYSDGTNHGTMKLTLAGTTKFSATKDWLDAGNPEMRPDLTFTLLRYRAGDPYTNAAQVNLGSGFVSYTYDSSKAEDEDKEKYSFTICFTDEAGEPLQLPKYDAEGCEYIYVAKETMVAGEGTNTYEQVFGKVTVDVETGTEVFSDKVYAVEKGELVEKTDGREPGNSYVYNGGTLSNRVTGSKPVTVTKQWNAAAYQALFQNFAVKVKLQVYEDEEWKDTEVERVLDSFSAERPSYTTQAYMPKFDANGVELQYRWVETAVALKDENGITADTSWIGLGENGSFTLDEIQFYSDSEQINDVTVITNSLQDRISYTLEKKWTVNGQDYTGTDWPGDYQGKTVKFYLYQTLVGQAMDTDQPDLILTLYKADETHSEGYAEISIPEDSPLEGIQLSEREETNNCNHAVIEGLPRYNEDGAPYEYVLLEETEIFATYENSVDDNGNYKSIVTNHLGGGGIAFRIMVRKLWNDGGDALHREPVTLQVYVKSEDGKSDFPYEVNNSPLTITLGEDGIWYEELWIQGKEGLVEDAGDIYVVETAMGDDTVYYNNDISYDNLYNTESTTTINSVTTDNHRYQVTYSYEKPAADGDRAYFTVSNRRLGKINVTVDKTWVSGNTEIQQEIQEVLEKLAENGGTELRLAVKLEFVNPEPGWEISDDYVTLGNTAEDVFIQDDKGNVASSEQALIDSEDFSNTLYFYNLPKYDLQGDVVEYQVKEVWQVQNNADGSWSVADLNDYLALQALCGDYQSTQTPDYQPGHQDGMDVDTQTVSIRNVPSGSKNVTWTKQWKDNYAATNNWRPDLYLNIYRVVHVEVEDEDGSYTPRIELVKRDYLWSVAGSEEGNTTWTITLPNVEKYDQYGFEIFYYAVERTVVNASQFDYQPGQYEYDGKDIGGRDAVDQTMIDAGYVLDLSDGEGTIQWADDNQRPTDIGTFAQGGSARYALREGGTFINQLTAVVSISGEKVWGNMPSNFPESSLPDIRLDVYRSVGGQEETAPFATLTIHSNEWQYLRTATGSYQYEILYKGTNTLRVTPGGEGNVTKTEFVGENGAERLPRYDEQGRLYSYSVKETVLFSDTGEGSGGETVEGIKQDDVFTVNDTSFRIVNTYDSETGSLMVKKFLYLPEGLTVFPAITFRVTQYAAYAAEGSQTVGATGSTWTQVLKPAEVEVLYRAFFPEDGTAETTYPGYVTGYVTFENLPLYAPDGTEYVYAVEEIKTNLPGYDTWVKAGDQQAGAFSAADPQSVRLEGLKPTKNDDVQATFRNRPKDDAADSFQATKNWDDLNNADGFRPTPEAFSKLFTLQRTAPQQSDYDNSITEPVEFVVESPTGWTGNSGTFTIKPKNGEGFDLYAPNGMRWTYTLSEKLTEDGRLQVKESTGGESDPVENHIYTPKNGTGKWTALTPANASNSNPQTDFGTLTNSITTTAYFKKVWADAAGNPLDEDYLGFSLSVTFQLQVSGRQQGAEENWDDWDDVDEDCNYAVLKSVDGDTIVTGEVSDSVWTGCFEGLPSVVKVEEQYVFLRYRVVETQVVYSGTKLTVTPQADGSYKYGSTADLISGGSYELNGNTTTSTNRLSTTEVSVTKVWEDSGNLYGTRPGKDNVMTWKSWFVLQRKVSDEQTWKNVAVIDLYGGNSQYDVSSERWRYTFSDLPSVNENNQPYEYRIRELQPKDGDYTLKKVTAESIVESRYNPTGSIYAAEYGQEGNAWTVTNRLNTYTVSSVQAEKHWVTPNGETPPAGVTFVLQYRTAGGQWQEYDRETVVEADSWTAAWENLPESLGGETVEYQVIEEFIGTGWAQTQLEAVNGSYEFWNAPSTSYTVQKTWVTDSADTTPHPTVTAALYRTTDQTKVGKDLSANRVGEPVTLTESGGWSHTFADLPQYDADGNSYHYYVLELDADGKAVENGGGLTLAGKDYVAEYTQGKSVANIKNTESVTLTGTKTWQAVDRPDVTLVLERRTDSAGWAPVKAEPEWSKTGSQWTFTFNDLPAVSASGDRYTYRVKEQPLSGYDTVYTTAEDGYLVAGTNHTFGDIKNIQQGSLKITKTVSGNLGETDKEFHFTVTLSGTSAAGVSLAGSYSCTYERQSGTETGSLSFVNGTAAFTLKHGESVTITGIPAGFTYTVVETDADAGGYSTGAVGDTGTIQAGIQSSAGFTNYRGSGGSGSVVTSVTVTKTWVDDNDAQGIRPDSIVVILYADGQAVGRQTITGGQGWKYTFTNLPKYDSAGKEITYTVSEETVPAGYQVEYQGTNIINRAQKDGTGGLEVSKTVSGEGADLDQGFRFTVTLSDASVNGTYGQMHFTDGVASFTLRHGESMTAAGLPAGVGYGVTELEADQGGYVTAATGDAGVIQKDETARAAFTNTWTEEKPELDPGSDPDDPGTEPAKDPGVPHTGDTSLTWLWAVLCLVSAGGFILLLLLRRNTSHGRRIKK